MYFMCDRSLRTHWKESMKDVKSLSISLSLSLSLYTSYASSLERKNKDTLWKMSLPSLSLSYASSLERKNNGDAVKRDTSALGWQNEKVKHHHTFAVMTRLHWIGKMKKWSIITRLQWNVTRLHWVDKMKKWKSETSSCAWRCIEMSTAALSVDHWPTYGMSAWKICPYHFFTFAFWKM